MSFNKVKLTKDEQNAITSMFQKVTSNDRVEAAKAGEDIAKALVLPLRQTLLAGDILGSIFEEIDFTNNPNVQFPLDLLVPGDEDQHYAYVIPGEGRIPERRVEGDYLMVPTYRIGNSIDCGLRLIRDANWPVVQRMMKILEAGFVRKVNDDGWQTILTAAADRNILVNDAAAAAGQFTPRLITLMSTIMRRNGGGNSSTLGRSRLTDLYVSPEAHMDIRSWGIDLIPDAARASIYYSKDNSTDLINVFGVNLHALDELGVGQDYQSYFTTTLAGSMATSDTEIAVGLDLQTNDSFVSPIREDLKIFEDNTMHRQGIFSLYGYKELGFAVLDSRRCILASM